LALRMRARTRMRMSSWSSTMRIDVATFGIVPYAVGV
jgi:hypothetical protein